MIIFILLLSDTIYGEAPGSIVYYNAPGGVQVAPWTPCIYMDPTTSVPFGGISTPSGITILTSSTEPPEGFIGGEVYIFIDDIRGWEQK